MNERREPALLFVAFLGFLVAGLTIDRDLLDVISFALSGIAYVIFLGYTIARYDPGETWTFLLLACSAGLFIGLGYGLREREPTVPTRTATAVVVGLVLISGTLVGVDALGGGVTYETELNETVTVTPPDENVRSDRESRPQSVTLGTVTARNEFVFRRTLSLRDVRGCVAGMDAISDERVRVHYSESRWDAPDTIAGSGTYSTEIVADIPVAANETANRTFAVERGDNCRVERDQPTIIVDIESRA